MGTPNWGKLYLEGRCKAVGVPFTEEECEEIKSGVSAKEIQERAIKKTDGEMDAKELKEIKKQLMQTLRDKGIGFANNETIEQLQSRLNPK